MKAGSCLSILIAGSMALAAGAAWARTPSDAAVTIAKTGQIVEFDEDLAMGTIVIRTEQRQLYYVLGDGRAIRYSVAVGEPRFQWTGESWISSKRQNPGWRPTPRMRRQNPGLPAYVGPGPRNPLGPRALYLGWGEYRIHGTNAPSSIGNAASSGCFRMHNADAIDLFDRVHIGAPVLVQQ